MSFLSNTFNNSINGVRPGCAGETGNSTGYDNTTRYDATCINATTCSYTARSATTPTTRGTSDSTQDILRCQDLYQRRIWLYLPLPEQHELFNSEGEI